MSSNQWMSEDFFAFLRSSFEMSSDAVFLFDSDLCICYANHSAATAFGVNGDDLTDASLTDFAFQFPNVQWQRLMQGKAEDTAATTPIAQHRDGDNSVTATYTLQTLSLAERPYYLCVGAAPTTDSAERECGDNPVDGVVNQDRRLVTELRKITQRLTKLELTANIGTWEVDLITDQLTWSAQTKRIHEVPDEYVPDVATSISYYKEGYDRDKIAEVYQRALASLTPWDEKLTIVTANGNERLVRAIGSAEAEDGVCTRLFGVFQDITNQEHLKSTLLESQRTLQNIMDRSPAVVYVKGLDGRYKFVNEKYLAIFGFEQADVIGKDDFELLPMKVALEVTNNDKRVLSSRANMTIEEEIQQKDGTHIYISEKFPLFDNDGDVNYLCGISTDITAQRHDEEKLKQAQKMDALGKLSGGIAHDINNLLGIISGHAELIAMEEHSLSATGTRSTLQIARACERGAQLTKRLLGFSRSKSTQLEVSNLNDLIQQNHEMLQRLLTASIVFDIEVDADLWECEVDKFDFEETLLNLIVNAQQSLSGKGHIRIVTANVTLGDISHGPQSLTGDHVKVTISDDGCGMDEDTQQRMFEPFFTTKGAEGSGLGLSQVYGFVNRCNGDVSVESRVDEGTSISLYFPRVSKVQFDTPEVNEPTREFQSAKSKQVVIVDDEPELSHVMNTVLSTNGYEVTVFNSPEKALAHIGNQGADILISDIVMPHIDGVELVKQVRQRLPEVKVLFISGYHDRDVDLEDNGDAVPILSKPFRSEQLLEELRRLVDDS